jgi:signal transduction histidine kinase
MNTSVPSRFSLSVRYVLGVVLVVALSLALFNWIMSPPLGELSLMAEFLSVTAIASGLVGYVAYRLGWLAHSPSLRLTLLGVYALAGILTFFNVWITARLMFASSHDLLLATVLLLFAGGMALVLGYFLANTLTDRIGALDRAAQEIRGGRLDARVAVEGSDELAALAHTFNAMAVRLQEADRRQRELETLRRDLVAWAGHDLQTPLASARAVVEALADGVVDDPEVAQRYLRTAQRDIQNLSLLIDDLFQMAQLDAGGLPLDREPASLADLISDTLESFSEPAARQGVTLAGDVAPGVDPVTMDVQRIGRVLNNLIANALRYTPAGGTVRVRAAPEGDGVAIEVCDTGEGIQPEDLPHVFERFYRGEKSRSRSTGGAGLGLAIARALVEAHGGRIGVESAPGRGACFRFNLPRRAP